MLHTYGVLQLTWLLTVLLSIVAVVTLLLAMRLYHKERMLVGIIVHLSSFTLAIFLIVNWWTTVDFMRLDAGNVLGVGIGTLVVVAIWLLWAGDRLLHLAITKQQLSTMP